jgi:hypothetical protein
MWWYVKYYVHRTSVDVNAVLLARLIEEICKCGERSVDTYMGRTGLLTSCDQGH